MPADHSIFNNLNQGQWLWYFHNFQKDQEDEFILKRDLIEYHASFIEPKAVQQIRDGRKKVVQVDDNSFAQNIQSIFGRPLPNSKNPAPDKKVENINWGDLVKNVQEYRNRKEEPNANYSYWVNMDL